MFGDYLQKMAEMGIGGAMIASGYGIPAIAGVSVLGDHVLNGIRQKFHFKKGGMMKKEKKKPRYYQIGFKDNKPKKKK